MPPLPYEPVDSADDLTPIFSQHRDHLFSVAYSILGTVTDTEDVLQETWLSWASAHRSTVVNPRAYLARITVNASLARLKQLRDDRLSYTGPWLPEPIVTDADSADHAVRGETVSLAMMVVLESLSPLERAVFVLNEAFGYRHTEIADVIGRTPAAVRQLAKRARTQVGQRRPRYRADPAAQRAVTERFLAAAAGGDLDELVAALAPDVTLSSDGGGKRRAALNVIAGRDKVVRFLVSVAASEWPDAYWEPVAVNGDLGFFVAGEALSAVSVLDIGPDGLVHGINSVMNPDKLPQDLVGSTTDSTSP